MASDVKYPMLDDVDLSTPAANHMDWLYYLRGKYEDRFNVTLFAIPKRSRFDWLKEINSIPWIQVAMHGWDHKEEEVVHEGMATWWMMNGLPLIYKGPNWKLPGDTKDNLRSSKFRIIEKPLPDDYIQGHIWNLKDLKFLESELEKGITFKLL